MQFGVLLSPGPYSFLSTYFFLLLDTGTLVLNAVVPVEKIKGVTVLHATQWLIPLGPPKNGAKPSLLRVDSVSCGTVIWKVGRRGLKVPCFAYKLLRS